MLFTRTRILIILILAGFLLVSPQPVRARAILIASSPAPNESLFTPPSEVRLTFDRPLDRETLTLIAVDESGRQADNADAHFDPDNLTTVIVTLPELDEGTFTVNYIVQDFSSTTRTGGSFIFTIRFATPDIRIVTPASGAALDGNSLAVHIDTGNFDYLYWEHSWRLYLDGETIQTTQESSVVVNDLQQGIHQIRAVLVDSNRDEVPAAESSINISVNSPTEDLQQPPMPAYPGLMISRNGAVLLAIVLLLCLSAGIYLGIKKMPSGDDLRG